MFETLVHIMTTVIGGFIVTLFAHWLRNRDDRDDK